MQATGSARLLKALINSCAPRMLDLRDLFRQLDVIAERRACRSRSQLIANRQLPDALACGCENRVAQSWRERRQSRLAHSSRGHIYGRRDDMDIRLQRRLIDADDLEIVEIPLLD